MVENKSGLEHHGKAGQDGVQLPRDRCSTEFALTVST